MITCSETRRRLRWRLSTRGPLDRDVSLHEAELRLDQLAEPGSAAAAHRAGNAGSPSCAPGLPSASPEARQHRPAVRQVAQVARERSQPGDQCGRATLNAGACRYDIPCSASGSDVQDPAPHLLQGRALRLGQRGRGTRRSPLRSRTEAGTTAEATVQPSPASLSHDPTPRAGDVSESWYRDGSSARGAARVLVAGSGTDVRALRHD